MSVWYKGDAIETIKKRVADKSVDLVYIDPPFATTKNYWDESIDWKKLFSEFYRILKKDGIIVIHCSVPFSYELIRQAPKAPNYSWYWKKENCTTPFLGGKQPLRNTEEILVWYNKKSKYYPQRVGTQERVQPVGGGNGKNSNYYDYALSIGTTKNVIGFHQTHHLDFKRNLNGFSTRPIEMIELILKSYTKEGDTILDCFCYKGFTASVANKLKRKCICIDKHFYPELLIKG